MCTHLNLWTREYTTLFRAISTSPGYFFMSVNESWCIAKHSRLCISPISSLWSHSVSWCLAEGKVNSNRHHAVRCLLSWEVIATFLLPNSRICHMFYMVLHWHGCNVFSWQSAAVNTGIGSYGWWGQTDLCCHWTLSGQSVDCARLLFLPLRAVVAESMHRPAVSRG